MNYYPTYFITNANLVNGELVLNVNGSPAISEHIHFALRFAPKIAVPSGLTSDTPVVLSINNVNYQMIDKYGETVTFKEGVFEKREISEADKNFHGTIVTWQPSEDFFDHVEVDLKVIRELLMAVGS